VEFSELVDSFAKRNGIAGLADEGASVFFTRVV